MAQKSLKILKGQPCNRHVLKKIVPYIAKNFSNIDMSGTLDDLEQLIDVLEPFIKVRHQSMGGHGTEAISRQLLIQTTGISPEDALENLKQLLDMALEQSVRLLPYHTLNTDIQRLLKWADGVSVTIDDIGD